MKRIESEYVFVLTNPGAEKALKLEVEMMKSGWRLSYQRRGFVTFKTDSAFSLESLDVELACARRTCVSLGKLTTKEEAEQRIIESLGQRDSPKIHHARFHERKMQGVRNARDDVRPEAGEVIGTVVELGPNEFWAGVHVHRACLSPDPAGDSGIAMPAESPSRAWLKLEEAVRFFDLKF
ncbi:MAG: hypothetical protein H8M99_06935, partial [Gloeobacteraceae cyanobacterium ES-bin-144]|nr:hypothetical protein [Verrucomicrobiales bacterium]